MPELLLEFLSEEIPARMQRRAALDLERMVNERLLGAGFLPEGVKAFATPRRLSLVATGLPGRQPDRKEEKKGPRVGAPKQAIDGFLKSAGLASLDLCEIREDKKGRYYVAVIDEKGRATADVIAEFIPEIVKGFPWPKSMRWADGDLRWVRPLHSILCCFDHEIVDVAVNGMKAGDATEGHRFMAPKEIRARTFDKYEAKLRAAKVILDAEARKELIAGEAKTLVEAQGLELVEDENLLNEVAGLAEWPVPMIGAFDEKFLALPDEVLRAVMRGHQKYFSIRDPKTGRLASKFVFVANLEPADGGKAMRAGYERVLAARLSDAWYLYHQDLKTWSARGTIEEFVEPLNRVTFFEGLGSMGDKARRVAALAKEIAPTVGADPALAENAALLAKADLVSAMVYEFPELQGVMGRYYFLAQSGLSSPAREAHSSPVYGGGGREATGGGSGAKSPSASPGFAPGSAAPPLAGERERQIADAIRDHYRPQGADDDVPTAPVSVAVALADKIDTLTAFWAIGKKPTGSSDPFALRRAAFGVIQVILDSTVRTRLLRLIVVRLTFVAVREDSADIDEALEGAKEALSSEAFRRSRQQLEEDYEREFEERLRSRSARKGDHYSAIFFDLLSFFHDRLKVYLRDASSKHGGHRYDAIDAVLTKADGTLEDDLVLIVRKLEALEAFLKTDDGANLAVAFKRAVNILKAEEKKDKKPAPEAVDEKLLKQAEEKTLFEHLKIAEGEAEKNVANEHFDTAMAFLSTLRAPIDSFFDKVTVNDKEEGLRANRLALLARFRAATATVADLSKLEG